jgi:hypothetical protein
MPDSLNLSKLDAIFASTGSQGSNLARKTSIPVSPACRNTFYMDLKCIPPLEMFTGFKSSKKTMEGTSTPRVL